MKQSRRRMHAILGARKPTVAARLVERRPDGTVRAEALVEPTAPGSAETGARKAERVVRAVERIFRLGAGRLSPGEWSSLFARRTPQPDNRWTLLVRLATEPQGDEGKLRDQFAALPDGAPFSMKLLLCDRRAKAPFARLPDVLKIMALKAVLSREKEEGVFRSDREFAGLLGEWLSGQGLSPQRLVADDVSQLREKLKNNGAEGLFPKRKQRQQDCQRRLSR